MENKAKQFIKDIVDYEDFRMPSKLKILLKIFKNSQFIVNL